MDLPQAIGMADICLLSLFSPSPTQSTLLEKLAAFAWLLMFTLLLF